MKTKNNTNKEILLAPYINNKIPSNKKLNSAVVIPALNPMKNLVSFVMQLIKNGIPQVVVVNDGSDNSYKEIFNILSKVEGCYVLTHGVNKGKGHALRTAFQYIYENFPHLDGVVTADADGQHTIEDICHIGNILANEEASIILGIRNFKEDNVPRRSSIGNSMTSRLFCLLYGIYISDTQTGLRGIHTTELPWLINTKGERYDYEINMLINARHRNLNFITVPIKTIYYNNNSESHYSTIKDSARIFMKLISGLIRYSGSSMVSGFVDISCFFILNSIVFSSLPGHIRVLSSTFLARLLSSICNFTINSRLIFNAKGKKFKALIKYYILCVSQTFASFIFVYGFSLLWNINESLIKILVDSILGLISYQFQLHWVFNVNKTTVR